MSLGGRGNTKKTLHFQRRRRRMKMLQPLAPPFHTEPIIFSLEKKQS